MKNTNDVRQILILNARVIQSHSAWISEWLGRFLCRFHYDMTNVVNETAKRVENKGEQLLIKIQLGGVRAAVKTAKGSLVSGALIS